MRKVKRPHKPSKLSFRLSILPIKHIWNQIKESIFLLKEIKDLFGCLLLKTKNLLLKTL